MVAQEKLTSVKGTVVALRWVRVAVDVGEVVWCGRNISFQAT